MKTFKKDHFTVCILYNFVQEKCFLSHWTYCISSICCSCGTGVSFPALGASFFFLFFLSFSFQLSTLFFQIGFPDSSFNSTKQTNLWLSVCTSKDIVTTYKKCKLKSLFFTTVHCGHCTDMPSMESNILHNASRGC